jgi:multidrug efflux pump subunit AcrA (membrane-fusion protein)
MARGFRASKRFYLLLAASFVLLVVFVAGAIYLMKKVTGNVRKLEHMTLYTEIESEAVVVRSERLITETASDSRILVAEGATVAEGDAIAVLYPYSYESTLAQICERENALYTQMESMLRTAGGQSLPDEVAQYNERIDTVTKAMRAAANGETDRAAYDRLEAELITLLEQRRTVMIRALDDASFVEDAVRDIDELKAAFESSSARKIVSGYNGYVSFYSDANEENLRDVSQLTVPLVRRILNSPSISMDNENFYYRIVTDRTTFYLAFVQGGKSADRLMPGQAYSFTVKGIKGAYQGRILTEKDTASGVLYVMQVDADVRPFLTTRVVEISVQNNASGLFVPLDYLQFTDGVPYLFVKTTDGSYQKIAVWIAGSDGKYAIVSARDSTISLFEGLKIRMPIEEEESNS